MLQQWSNKIKDVISQIHTVGEDTTTNVFNPEASNAASFEAFTGETFVNGLLEAFCGAAGAEAGADSVIGLLGTGGAVVGETTGSAGGGAGGPPMSLLRCISKSPTWTNRWQHQHISHYYFS